MAACGLAHSVVASVAGRVWNFGWGMFGILGHNEQDRLVPTRVDPHHFAHASISAVAAGECHSAAVTAGALSLPARLLLKSGERSSAANAAAAERSSRRVWPGSRTNDGLRCHATMGWILYPT